MQNQEPIASTRFSRSLGVLCAVSALFGGLVLVGLALMVCASIALRASGFNPVQGDFELLQVGLAVAVGGFLPWCHLRGSNIYIDFVTARASRRTQSRLDAFAGILVAIMMGLVAWRAGVGALAAKASGEVTMIRGFPLWISYMLMTPGLALTSLVALDIAWRRWKDGA
ncbi:MAG: TRAP transporter small permease [Burkholderiales bacterium]|jgi:TRAP-type C4-dicarboxylate transport system permease small subunit